MTVAVAPENSSKPWMLWTGRVLTGLVALLFMGGLTMVFSGNPEVAESMVKYGYPEGFLHVMVALELTCLVLYLVPPTAILGAILLTGYLGGAVATHLRVGESPAMAVIVGVVAWAGLFLREERLRALIPLRR